LDIDAFFMGEKETTFLFLLLRKKNCSILMQISFFLETKFSNSR